MILLQHTSMDQVSKLSERFNLQLEGVNQNQILLEVPLFHKFYVHLLSVDDDVVHELPKDPRTRETAVPTLLCSKGIALEPSMTEYIRRSRTVRRAILHH